MVCLARMLIWVLAVPTRGLFGRHYTVVVDNVWYTVKPVLKDHCHERLPVLKDHQLLVESPTFQCN